MQDWCPLQDQLTLNSVGSTAPFVIGQECRHWFYLYRTVEVVSF